MIKNSRRDQTSFGSLDYLLMAVGNCFAVYSAGMAVGADNCGLVFVALIIVGTLFSLGVRRWLGDRKIITLDASLYTIATFAAVIFSSRLNTLLPDDGIPPDVTTAGWLCWMLSFGSFLTWRDRTLLFQAVPTIALFGLIGCYDTYAPAPFLFFGFLLCLATLLGRSHSRDMLRQAVLSGYFNRADSPLTISEHPEQSPELYEDIKRGPWRWLAGPEWALASGLVIVVLSLLGAPVIRLAVEPISGAIKVFAPRHLRASSANSQVATQESSYEVGRGPLNNSGATPRAQFTGQMDRVRYLRTSVFDIYTGHGWSSSVPNLSAPESAGIGKAAIDTMTGKSKFHIAIGKLTPAETIPLPLEVTNVSPATVELNSGGSLFAEDPHTQRFEIDGVESTTLPKNKSVDLPEDVRENCLSKANINPNVIQFAESAIPANGSDYDKAVAIKATIANRCKYFKNPSPVPPGRDAADYFLNDSQLGYCDLFATAMVECARAVGIPAHFCIGYLPDAQNRDKRGQTVIFDQDYHAWAELYFQGAGWVIFDATEGAQSLDENKSSINNLKGGNIFATILDVLIGTCVVAGAVILLKPKLLKKKGVGGGDDRSEVKKVYLAFSRALARSTRQRRGLSETAEEYLSRIGPALGESRESAVLLNARLESALYGKSAPDEDTVRALGMMVKQLRRNLKSTPKREIS